MTDRLLEIATSAMRGILSNSNEKLIQRIRKEAKESEKGVKELICDMSFELAEKMIEKHNQIVQQEIKDGNIVLFWDDLKVGDKIVFDKVLVKSLTVGKEYIVRSVDARFKEQKIAWYDIIDDNGDIKSLRKTTRGYKVRRV